MGAVLATAPLHGMSRRWLAVVLVLAAVAAALYAPGDAYAQASAGGAFAGPAPKPSTLRCRTECAGPGVARTGSLIWVSGRELDGSELVTFMGGAASGDEVAVEPERVSATRITVRIPRGAVSGPVVVTGADGQISKPTRRGIRIDQVQTRRAAGGIELAVTGKKVFFDGERRPTVTFSVREAGRVVVELVRIEDGAVVVRWDQGTVAAGEQRTVTWDGLAGGIVQKEGRYEFRVTTLDGQGGVRASSAQATPPPSSGHTGPPAPVSPDSFVFLRHKFPVRGAHDYGEFQASFGGGRNHQGHDVFAKCGTPLVAARGGIVKLRQTHSRAGHYIVIDGEHTDVDYVYMHLRDEALVAKGDRVLTGQLIGYVGDTGRASGCHLHFELWSGPGWYTGGSAFDPLPELKAWDRFS